MAASTVSVLRRGVARHGQRLLPPNLYVAGLAAARLAASPSGLPVHGQSRGTYYCQALTQAGGPQVPRLSDPPAQQPSRHGLRARRRWRRKLRRGNGGRWAGSPDLRGPAAEGQAGAAHERVRAARLHVRRATWRIVPKSMICPPPPPPPPLPPPLRAPLPAAPVHVPPFTGSMGMCPAADVETYPACSTAARAQMSTTHAAARGAEWL